MLASQNGAVPSFARALEEVATAVTRPGVEVTDTAALTQSLVDALPVRVYWKDRESRYLGCNQRFANDCGCASPSEVIGRRDDELIWARYADRYRADDVAVMESGEPHLEYEEPVVTVQGERWLQTSKAPLRGADGEIIGVACAYTDLSERKRLEDELAEREAALTERLKELDCLYEVMSLLSLSREPLDLVLAAVADRIPRAMRYPELAGCVIHVVDHDAHSSGFAPLLKRLLASIEVDGQVAGFIEVGYRQPVAPTDDETFLPEERRLIETLAADIGAAVTRRLSLDRLRLLATAIDAAAESIVITDLGGRIEYVNPAFERLTGYSREQAIGLNPRLLKSGEHPDEFYREMWQCLASGQVWRGSFINRRRDGTLFDEDATIAPVRDESGEIAHFVAVKHDVTELRALQREVVQAQKMRAIGQLAAGLSHELNTPAQYVGDNLCFVQQAVAALLDDRPDEVDPDETIEAIGAATAGIAEIARIVNAMRTFAGENGADHCDLNRSVRAVVTIARGQWRACGELELDLADDLPLTVGRPAEVNQALLQLLQNAADAVARRGDGRGWIRVGTRRDGDQAVLTVADSGVGIPESVRERVYEPFFTTKEVGAGAGQGLYVVHRVVTSLGGRVSFDSREGEGTTFEVRLPLQ